MLCSVVATWKIQLTLLREEIPCSLATCCWVLLTKLIMSEIKSDWTGRELVKIVAVLVVRGELSVYKSGRREQAISNNFILLDLEGTLENMLSTGTLLPDKIYAVKFGPFYPASALSALLTPGPLRSSVGYWCGPKSKTIEMKKNVPRRGTINKILANYVLISLNYKAEFCWKFSKTSLTLKLSSLAFYTVPH